MWIYEKRTSLRKIILGPYVEEWENATNMPGQYNTEFVVQPVGESNFDIHPKDVIAQNSLTSDSGIPKQIPVTATVLSHEENDQPSMSSALVAHEDSHPDDPNHAHNLVAINLYYS